MRSRQAGKTNNHGQDDCAFVHHTLDEDSEIAYAKTPLDERKETAAGVCDRTKVLFTALEVTSVITEDGASYRFRAFPASLLRNSELSQPCPIAVGRRPGPTLGAASPSARPETRDLRPET